MEVTATERNGAALCLDRIHLYSMYSTRLKMALSSSSSLSSLGLWGTNKRFCHWAFMIMKSIMTGDGERDERTETEMKAHRRRRRRTGKGSLGTMNLGVGG